MAPIFVPDSKYDWHFWRLREDFNIRIEPISESNKHKAGDAKPQSCFQLVARPYGWSEDFVLQDSLIRRTESTAENEIHLRAVGRRDDLIVLATGEKVLPRILERILEESPLVKTAVAFDEGQFELGVIVEPSMVYVEIEKLKRSIWPMILEAGKQMDSHAKISSFDCIIITTDEHKIPRSDKGSVSRKEIYQQFDTQIRQAYKLMERNITTVHGHINLSNENLEGSLKMIVEGELADVLGSNACAVEEDLFELGVNSLQCVRIYRTVQHAVRISATSAFSLNMPSKDFVYKNPTIARMAAALRLGEEKTFQDQLEDYVTPYGLSTKSEAGHITLLTGAPEASVRTFWLSLPSYLASLKSSASNEKGLNIKATEIS